MKLSPDAHRDLTHRVLFGLLLIVLSVVVYAIHYVIFRDAHHIFLYPDVSRTGFGRIAFVFVEVLLVTLIIHQVLSEREKRSMLKKLNPDVSRTGFGRTSLL